MLNKRICTLCCLEFMLSAVGGSTEKSGKQQIIQTEAENTVKQIQNE